MLMDAFETIAIASPIMRFVGASVMPGFFQLINLVRIDPVPVARTAPLSGVRDAPGTHRPPNGFFIRAPHRANIEG
jgi:hypothetical protein